MARQQYEMRLAEEIPRKDLLPIIKQKRHQLDMALFGKASYKENITSMEKIYFHSRELPNITFRPATVSESIAAAAYDFENSAKPQILGKTSLQLGYVVTTPEGIFVDTTTTDEDDLKEILANSRKVNGVWVYQKYKKKFRGTRFVPNESFLEAPGYNTQSWTVFVRGGLARALEYTSPKELERFGEANNLSKIASSDFYRNGVRVNFKLGEICVNKPPVLEVALMYSGNPGGKFDNTLVIESIPIDNVTCSQGVAFGVLDDSTKKNKE